jgi:hypothetical protein
VGDDDVEWFVADAVERLARLSTVRPATHVLEVPPDAAVDDVYLALLAVLDEPAT